MKKFFRIVLTALLVLGLFASCNPDAASSLFDNNPPAPPAPTTKVLLQFTSQQDGSTIQWISNAVHPSTAKISYSLDGVNWTEQDLSAGPAAITVNNGQTVYFKGNNDAINSGSSDNYSYLKMTGSFTGRGNLVSLLDETFELRDIPDYAFIYLFYDCEALTDFELIVDADTIGDCAFCEAFYNVGGDVTVSDIKVPTVGEYAFEYMIYTKTGDVTVGDIEVTDVADDAFYGMLYYSSGDITVGDITVNGSLGDYTYSENSPFASMFVCCCRNATVAKEGLNTITVGDIHIMGNAGDYTFFHFFYECYYANINMGNFTVDGDLGEFALTYFFYYDSYYSNAKITMGDISIGGTAETDSFYEMFNYCNYETYDPDLVADPDKGKITIGTMTFGNVAADAFEYMIDTSTCTDSVWTLGDVTVTGTTAAGAFDKSADNFLCGVTPVNSDSFKVNGVLYFD